MNNYEKELYDKIAAKVAEVVSDVCNNPLVFVSETDIHVLMMKALMEISCLKKRCKTNVTKGMNKEGRKSEDVYRTMLVHKEYGHNIKKGLLEIVWAN